MDLLYAFQVNFLPHVHLVLHVNFLPRQRESCTWFWNTWAGASCLCTWRGRAYSLRTLHAFMLRRSPLPLSTSTDRYKKGPYFMREKKLGPCEVPIFRQGYSTSSYCVNVYFLIRPYICRGSFTATWSLKISSLMRLVTWSSLILASVKSPSTNRRWWSWIMMRIRFCKWKVQRRWRVIILFQVTHTFCGTIEYMAPEILTRTGHGKVWLIHFLVVSRKRKICVISRLSIGGHLGLWCMTC